MSDIDGVWDMKQISKGLLPLKRSKLSKKSQDNEYEIKKNI